MRLSIPEWAEIIIEGMARVIVPKRDLFLRKDGVYEPSHAPVFYNPGMVFNRDLMIAFLNTYSRYSRVGTASDPMAATGVRGVRIALEVMSVGEVYLNDIDPIACKLVKSNVYMNSLASRTRIYCEDANQLMISLSKSGIHVDYLDIDPYGSPAPYIGNAVRHVRIGGVLAVTATDLGPLTGRYPAKTYRRYRSLVMPNVDFRKEMGLRVLIAYIASRASEENIALTPILAYYADHYYRVYFSADKGASKAGKIVKRIGYVAVCQRCSYRDVHDVREPVSRCPRCGSELYPIGPLWLGSLADLEFSSKFSSDINKYSWLQTIKRISSLLDLIIQESQIDRPYFYRIDTLSRISRINMPSREKLIECLRSIGYRATRTHFDSIGIKTDANIDDIYRCIATVCR